MTNNCRPKDFGQVSNIHFGDWTLSNSKQENYIWNKTCLQGPQNTVACQLSFFMRHSEFSLSPTNREREEKKYSSTSSPRTQNPTNSPLEVYHEKSQSIPICLGKLPNCLINCRYTVVLIHDFFKENKKIMPLWRLSMEWKLKGWWDFCCNPFWTAQYTWIYSTRNDHVKILGHQVSRTCKVYQ